MNGNSLCVAGDGKSGILSKMIEIELQGVILDMKYQDLVNKQINMRYEELKTELNKMLMNYIMNSDTDVAIYEEIKNFNPDIYELPIELIKFDTDVAIYDDITTFKIDQAYKQDITDLKLEKIRDISDEEIDRRKNVFFDGSSKGR